VNDLDSVLNRNATVSDSTMDMLNLAMSLEVKSGNDPIQKQALKDKANDLSSMQALIAQVPGNDSLITGDKMFTSQIYTSDSDQIKNAAKNGLAIYNLTQCEIVLREHYNLTEDTKILYVSNKFDGSLNENKTDSFMINAYDAVTRQKLDFDICKDIENSVQVPLSSDVNMTLYNEMKSQGIDIFNSSDVLFTDRCSSYLDPKTGKDTSLNYRREKIYQQVKPVCIGVNCTYEGINDLSYVQCNCKGIKSNVEVFNSIVNLAIEDLSRVNLGIVLCYAIVPSNLSGNLGFYVSIIYFLLCTAVAGVLFYIYTQVIVSNLRNIIYYDCCRFNPETMKMDKYFKKQIEELIGSRRGSLPESTPVVRKETEKDNPVKLTLNPTTVEPTDTGVDNRTKADTDDKGGVETERALNKDIALSRRETGNDGGDQQPAVIVINDCEDTPDGAIEIPKEITLLDYLSLNPVDLLKYDKRTSVGYLKDFLFVHHSLMNIIFYRSIKNPIFIRLIQFVFGLSTHFAVNALLFTDKYIDGRLADPNSVR
jgi:hypothetical protein